MIPYVLVAAVAVVMIAIERRWPGRALPQVKGWMRRVVLLDVVQVGLVLAFGLYMEPLFLRAQLTDLSGLGSVGGALVGYLAITFVYYWWHRWRHEVDWLWRIFHQVHHSPSRIEIVTSFYKHPAEILANTLLSTTLLYLVMGLDAVQVMGVALISVVAELFYHWNVQTPHALGWFIQRPEMHQIHHQRGRHSDNYGDLPIWDWLFGTYNNPERFEGLCGFGEAEQRLPEMLAFIPVIAVGLADDAHATTVDGLRAALSQLRTGLSPRRLAMALTVLGALAMAGDTLGSRKLTGLGLATGAAPYPKVFTSRDGLEAFSSDLQVSWTEHGERHQVRLDPETLSHLEGPYNRRNPYGAALAGGPYLSSQSSTEPMLNAMGQWAFCRPHGVLQELDLAAQPTDIRVDVVPLPTASATPLPLSLDVSCS